jgi:biopolymer transport protein TolQ
MDNNTIDSVNVGGNASCVGFSPLDMFLGADWVVQLVMVILVAASFWCWTIIFAKLAKMKTVQASAERFEESFWSGGALESLYERVGSKPKDPMSAVFAAAMKEWKRSSGKGRAGPGEVRLHLKERIEKIMRVTINREIDQLETQMTFLASVGSTAPFIGLFGTVWGIMHSFQSIAASQSTNLAVVAPGIAEALFATALGLVAAIPAVLAYNKISSQINRFAVRLDGFVDEFVAIISRQLEGID